MATFAAGPLEISTDVLSYPNLDSSLQPALVCFSFHSRSSLKSDDAGGGGLTSRTSERVGEDSGETLTCS